MSWWRFFFFFLFFPFYGSFCNQAILAGYPSDVSVSSLCVPRVLDYFPIHAFISLTHTRMSCVSVCLHPLLASKSLMAGFLFLSAKSCSWNLVEGGKWQQSGVERHSPWMPLSNFPLPIPSTQPVLPGPISCTLPSYLNGAQVAQPRSMSPLCFLLVFADPGSHMMLQRYGLQL